MFYSALLALFLSVFLGISSSLWYALLIPALAVALVYEFTRRR